MKSLVVFLSLSVFLSSSQAAIPVLFSYDGTEAVRNRSIKLDFSINDEGVVSLDASTQSPDTHANVAVDKWDNENIGTVEDKSLFGKSFSLQSFGENEKGGSPPLILRPEEGGVLGVGGHNPGRIDGTGIKTGPNKEKMSWVFSGDVELVLMGFSCGLVTNNSGIIVEDADSDMRTGPLKIGTPAKQDILQGTLSLVDGEKLVFKADPDLMQGAGLVGFDFEIKSPE
ncbi:hypothetical protein G0Q06_03900 [Puniceicoccales bacterium CK1056]|uniref:Uncharacterized protein n=1 Tax=Oceanipulchritudo coccoides TaxID=2706888 RepID=A0A6B2M1C6_9BACT|nr:hypothetical protein [Oceanipulchritudo coccoides]NDV61585.1 hypothetical protein [Oceanipulchritudo coccoides]